MEEFPSLMSESDIQDKGSLSVDQREEVEDAQAGRPTFKQDDEEKVAKQIKNRWKRLDPVMRRKQAQLKVNFLRYLGNQFAQIHPRDPDRLLVPQRTDQTQPPSLNKLRRSVHQYISQITADEPVVEAVPATHDIEDRDAAEASTHMLRGEWHRLSLQRELQRAAQFAAVFRSGFWFFEWDDTAGGKTAAQKFFTDPETGERFISFVDGEGNPVESEEDAAKIWKGNTTVEVLTPMNVRWQGGRYAHNADELMVAKVITLRQLYEMEPSTRDVKLNKILGNVPPKAAKWLQDIRGENFSSGITKSGDVDLGGKTGRGLSESSSLLDHPVFLIHYFLDKGRQYPQGFHGIVAGRHLVHRGNLRYGVMPIAHFKLLDELSEPLGTALIDMLKDPQELLDFVNGQILRHLQMMRRRWFLPQQANVSTRDLMNPDKTVIEYNARVDPPTAEDQPELSQSIFEYRSEMQRDFDDVLGLHPSSRGVHVKGVGSGRHAEALQEADRTLLGLTRTQFKEALERTGVILLKIAKKEWTRERRVRYMGESRQFIDKAFDKTDFRDTSDVRLRESTMLMLTPSQKLETIFAFAEMGALTPDMVRRLAPLRDTAGLKLSEDEHVIHARRQNERFLDGPTEEAEEAWEDFRSEMEQLQNDIQNVSEKNLEQAQLQPAMQAIQQRQQEAEAEFNAVISKSMPMPGAAESAMPSVAALHIEEHARALASEKISRLPDWWVEKFVEIHFQQNLQAAAPPQQGEEAPPPEQEGDAAGLGPGEIQAASSPDQLPAPGVTANQ